jgi:hypothetical protein
VIDHAAVPCASEPTIGGRDHEARPDKEERV